MKTPEEWIQFARNLWVAHPDDYDPTDDQMRDFVRVIQTDAVEWALTAVARSNGPTGGLAFPCGCQLHPTLGRTGKVCTLHGNTFVAVEIRA